MNPGRFDTGLRKFGAILGDKAEVGCNAVLQPGTLLGPRALGMPTMAFAGYRPPASATKSPRSPAATERASFAYGCVRTAASAGRGARSMRTVHSAPARMPYVSAKLRRLSASETSMRLLR